MTSTENTPRWKRYLAPRFLAGKVRERGVVWCFKAGLHKAVRRLPGSLTFYYHLVRLILTPNSQKKRILGLWDYEALPWSVGDPLVFLETLSVIKLENNAEEIDICVVYNRDTPGGHRGRRGWNILSIENAQDYMLEFLPLFGTCPYLGSVFQFNSREEFYRFLRGNIERYYVFPRLSQHLGETYNFYGGASYREILEFYHAHGYIPHLRIGDRDSSWAQWFYLSHLPKGAVPITLSLKRTSHTPERNADPAVWLSFMDKCKMHFPEAFFVVIGLREEIFGGLRNRSNVIIAKDFGTSIIEDLALIRTSSLYMATCSGVATIALFSDLPFLIFQWPGYSLRHMGLNPGEKFPFLTDKQKIFDDSTTVTPELLFDEFKKLYSTLDRNRWRSMASEKQCMKQSHPGAKVNDKEPNHPE